MGLFGNIKRALAKINTVSGIRMMTQYGTAFSAWNGSIYESDIVRACLRPKVKQIGKLTPKHLRERTDDDGNKTLDINPDMNIRLLLEEPNPLMTWQKFAEKMETMLALNNNAFALLVKDEYGTITQIFPINAGTVESHYVDGALWLRFFLTNGKMFDFPYTEIIHLRNDYNTDDVFGESLAPSLAPLMNVVTTTDQGIVAAIKNSSIVRWLLKFTNAMRTDDLKESAKEFADNFLATEQGTGVAAVDSKCDAQQIEPKDYVPNAAQMNLTKARIYALMNTNEAIVTSSANEDQREAYFSAEIEPDLIQFGTEITRKIFTRRQRAFGNKIVLEASAWDSASISTKLNLVQMVDRGAITINEWRQAFNLAPVPGGDVLIRRLDTAQIENSGEEGGNTE